MPQNLITSVARRPWRAAAAALAALLFSFVLPGSIAGAAKVPLCTPTNTPSPCRLEGPAVQWFWSSNSKITSCVPPPEGSPPQVPALCGTTGVTGGVYSNAAGVASPITSGHIGVAMKNGDPDMRGYIKFDLGTLPPDIVFDAFKIVMQVSSPNQEHVDRHQETGGKPPATVGSNRAKILACLAAEPWGAMTLDGGDPPYSTKVDQSKLDPADPDPNDGVSTEKNEPAVDCGVNVTGQPSPNGQFWTFDIAPIANLWVSGQRFNEGVALMPVPSGVGDTWTIEFHGPALTVRETVCSLPGGSCPVEPPDTTPDSDEIVWITKAEAPVATVETHPAPPEEEGNGGGTTIVNNIVQGGDGGIPSFGDPTGQEEQPPVFVVGPSDPVGTLNPGFYWWMIPMGLLGVGLYTSAIGTEGSFLRSGNRVASVLRARRLAGIEGVEATVEEIAD